MKLFKFLIAAVISPFVLIGCSEPVPECGDVDVVEEVKRIAVDLHRHNIIVGLKNNANRMKNQMFAGLGGGYGDVMGIGDTLLGSVFKMPDPKSVSVEVKEIKFMQLVSFDKEIPKRTCKATLLFNIDVPKAKLKRVGSGEAEVLMMMLGMNKQLDFQPIRELNVTYSITPNQQNKEQSVINVHIEH